MNGVPPIIKEMTLSAPPEALFDAYTDPSHLEKWFAQTATIDLNKGGAGRFEFGRGLAAEGRVLEAVRPHRFIWTWERSITPDQDGVEQVYESDIVNSYVFEPAEGGTRFIIEERNHVSQELRDMSEGGIDQMLRTLKAFVENGTVVDWSQAPE
jgi:uncharacterized protein YndB with AHSA1/START domain